MLWCRCWYVLREITFAADFDGLPLGLAAHTERMSGCGRHGTRTPQLSYKALNQKAWLPDMDSNHDSRLQRPLSYH